MDFTLPIPTVIRQPSTCLKSRKLRKICFMARRGSSNGTGGMTTKLQAAQMRPSQECPSLSALQRGYCSLTGGHPSQPWHTLLADDHAMNQRKQWMAFYAGQTRRLKWMQEQLMLCCTRAQFVSYWCQSPRR